MKYNVAILGATGAVGREMIKILQERDFPINKLRLLASSHSAGKIMATKWGAVMVEETTAGSFVGSDIVLGAADNEIAKRYAPAIINAGAVFIDNSSAFRLDQAVPLIVPEINPRDIKDHQGIIANPNCSTIITLMAIYPLIQLSPVTALYVSTYQAVSGAGARGPEELLAETTALAHQQPAVPELFPYPIAYNLIPQIGGFTDNDYTQEEMKLQNEGRKITHLPELKVSCTCVRVPVLRSHSISAIAVTRDAVDIAAFRRAIATAPGCKLVDDPQHNRYPMPLDTSDQDLVYVGRIRKDLIDPKGINLWCCGDQLRKGAATNAVQIAELLIAE